MDYRPTNHAYTAHEVNDGSAPVTGGRVERYVAGAALNVGDYVFLSAAKTVNKSVTAANYQLAVGVVVGGKQTNGRVLPDSTAVGTLAANNGEDVLVQVDGIAYAVADAAVAAAALLTIGATTAGRVDDSVSATQGQIVGISLEAAAAAGSAFLIKIIHM